MSNARTAHSGTSTDGTSLGERTDAPGSTLSRRTVMTGAAWAMPAVALAVAAPAASASGGHDIVFDFVAAGLQFDHTVNMAVLLAITNHETTAQSAPITIVISNIPAADMVASFDNTTSTYQSTTDSNDTRSVANQQFAAVTPNDGSSLTLTSGDVSIGVNATLYLFFTLQWKTSSPRTAAFLLAGSLDFGGRTITTNSDNVSISYGPTQET